MPYITKKQLKELRQIMRAAEMRSMSVAFPNETVTVERSHTGEHDGVFKTDDFIRERTASYRETWIVGPLRDLLEELGE